MAQDSIDPTSCGWFVEVTRLFGVEGGVCLNDIIPFLTPFAIIISAIVALVVGVGGWVIVWGSNRRLAKKEAALVLLLSHEPSHRDDFLSLWMMIQKGVDFEALVDFMPIGVPDHDWDTDRQEQTLPVEQRQWLIINKCLNYYEVIAIAIEKHAINEAIVREFLGPRLKNFVKNLFPFIKAVRNLPAGDRTTWIRVEELARKWGAKLD